MKQIIDTVRKAAWKGIAGLAMSAALASCSMMEEELPPCPQGLDIHFKYDYNLERADMFTDHVGGVTVYIFDENGKFITKQSQANNAASKPLQAHDYAMHFDVNPGKYKYTAIAWQKSYEECLATPGAKFRIAEPAAANGTMQDIALTLDSEPIADDTLLVNNGGQPLDTLWHGMQTTAVEVVKDKVTSDTVSLVRDTKQINITLRDIDEPWTVDVSNYEMSITDHNSRLLWDNSVDESNPVKYTPYATWNTEDRQPSQKANADEEEEGGTGIIAHADFMTSRILYHENAKDDAILSVRNKQTGIEVIRVDLADLLSRLRTSADRYYSPQEFLDRGYDYRLSFYLKGDRWAYVDLQIGVLSWSKRVQFVEF